ncbi:unnamed protein product [marine sediment metagenome]|uniref:Uncharacterized protein n=1 Tax=marine sediment metagenome TaxID=412755 RepID=X1K6M2_9ZZZZ
MDLAGRVPARRAADALRRGRIARARRLALRVVLVSGGATIADRLSGYHGLGSLMAVIAGIRLPATRSPTREEESDHGDST